MSRPSSLKISDSSVTDEPLGSSRNVLFSPQLSSEKSIEIEELDVFDSPACALSEEEEGFLEAVRQGDEEAVKTFVTEKRVNVNCRDVDGETALQIAVGAKSTNIIPILLRNHAEVGNALFQAVRNGNLHCVRLLVAYDSRKKDSSAVSIDRAAAMTCKNSPGAFDEFLTPLALAVLNGDYKIAEFLMSKGYKVEDPLAAQKIQRTDTGTEKESMVRLKDSVVELNTNRALASPVYLAQYFLHENKHWGIKKAEASPSDPIFRAIVLKKKLEDLAESEDEFRDDYLALSAQCENFAISLLDECRNLEEVAAVMELPDLDGTENEVLLKEREKRLRVLHFAIKCRNRKFLAHPYSQVMLNSVVYRHAPGWHRLAFPAKLVLVTLYTFIMPLCMLGYILIPANRFTKKFEIPLVKLANQACSVLWFLVLVTLSAFQDKYDSYLSFSPLNIFIAVWVIGITVQEAKHAVHQGIDRYLSEWWHLAIIPMIAFYVTAAILWFVGYAFIASDAGTWAVHVREILGSTSLAPYQLLLLSNSFYAFAVVLTFFEASHVLQVNATLGPLHLSLMNMGKDILKFLFLFGLNFCAFSLAMRKLYSQYVQSAGRRGSQSNNGTATHTFERIEGTFRTLFWALFGHVEFSVFDTSEDYKITTVTGELLFAVYCLSSVLVALNLLIAMLSNTFQSIANDRDINFKFARTRIWMYYVSEVSALPPPFNLIPIEMFKAGLRWLAKRYRWIRKCFVCIAREQVTYSQVKRNEKRRRTVIKNLIHRYFSEDETTQNGKNAKKHPQPPPLKEVATSLQSMQKSVKRFQSPPSLEENRVDKKEEQDTSSADREQEQSNA